MKEIVFGPEEELKRYYGLVAEIVYGLCAIPGIILLLFYPFAGVIYLLPIIGLTAFTFYWISRFYETLEYRITDENVTVKKGVWWEKESTVPMEMITNVDKTQNPFERRYGIGKVHVQTAGAGGQQAARAEAVFTGIKNVVEVKEEVTIRKRQLKPTKTPETELPKTEEKTPEKILQELMSIKEILKK
ncbi:MAG: PH domain-containing protein [Euryarchaeota archaeon]|nr:PH domain-containing protein [Euryarchaeota archaeon]